MSYITLPSKLNDMSLEELDMQEPATLDVILRYIGDVSEDILAEFGILMRKDLHKVSDIFGVTYDHYRKRWRARRKISGKSIFIAQGIDKSEVEAAAIEFAKKNSLKVYR